MTIKYLKQQLEQTFKNIYYSQYLNNKLSKKIIRILNFFFELEKKNKNKFHKIIVFECFHND